MHESCQYAMLQSSRVPLSSSILVDFTGLQVLKLRAVPSKLTFKVGWH